MYYKPRKKIYETAIGIKITLKEINAAYARACEMRTKRLARERQERKDAKLKSIVERITSSANVVYQEVQS